MHCHLTQRSAHTVAGERCRIICLTPLGGLSPFAGNLGDIFGSIFAVPLLISFRGFWADLACHDLNLWLVFHDLPTYFCRGANRPSNDAFATSEGVSWKLDVAG